MELAQARLNIRDHFLRILRRGDKRATALLDAHGRPRDDVGRCAVDNTRARAFLDPSLRPDAGTGDVAEWNPLREDTQDRNHNVVVTHDDLHSHHDASEDRRE